MRILLGLSLALFGFVLLAAPAAKGKASVKKKTTTAKSSGAKTGAKKASTQTKARAATARKGASKQGKQTARRPAKPSGKSRASSTSRRRRASIPSFRAGQQRPTPDRVKDIQSALIARGYLEGEADGNWGGSTVDAFKRFQQDQNLNADGKLGSMSLIALGLGPKRSGLAAAPKPAAAPAQAVPTPAPLTSQDKEPQ